MGDSFTRTLISAALSQMLLLVESFGTWSSGSTGHTGTAAGAAGRCTSG